MGVAPNDNARLECLPQNTTVYLLLAVDFTIYDVYNSNNTERFSKKVGVAYTYLWYNESFKRRL